MDLSSPRPSVAVATIFDTFGTDEQLRAILEMPTWAIVGLSGEPWRAATDVAAFLQRQGKRIVPVHPTATEVLGEKVYPSLSHIPFPVDVVDVFRRSEEAGVHADEAVAIGAKAVQFQLGVIDEQAWERTKAAGVLMVMNACPERDWPRLMGRAAES